MAKDGLQLYLDTAVVFVQKATSTRDAQLRLKACAVSIAKTFDKDAAQVEKALQRTFTDSSRTCAEYRTTVSAKEAIEKTVKKGKVSADQSITAGARLRIGDTMYDRSADSIINSIEQSLL